MTDSDYMARAVALAERGRGRTSPNPMVGAIVVDREGVIVGRGAHEYAGGPHAEMVALREAGVRARNATLYCTLEPCSHVGRTGPCAPAVADTGVARVVIAGRDPNPLVDGQGIDILRSRGIEVTTGVLADEARALNRPFLTVMTRQRPFVTMKVALSADQRIAEGHGLRTPMTGEAANRVIHRARAEVDAGAELLAIGEEPRLLVALRELARRSISSVIVEGGVALHRAFWDAKLVDRVQVYMSPRRLGPRGIEWLGFPLPHLGTITTRELGADTLAEAYVHGAD
jgi:diaminohydroxyphosphoribosylaminopyrimidine deaminase/5-amino-6-(5-phosphoribosylamino)uracil reductase